MLCFGERGEVVDGLNVAAVGEELPHGLARLAARDQRRKIVRHVGRHDGAMRLPRVCEALSKVDRNDR